MSQSKPDSKSFAENILELFVDLGLATLAVGVIFALFGVLEHFCKGN